MVDEAALVAVHGFQLPWLAGGADFVGGFPDVCEEEFVLLAAVVIDVDADARGVGDFLPQQFIDEVLEVFEAGALASDEMVGERLIGDGDLEAE